MNNFDRLLKVQEEIGFFCSVAESAYGIREYFEENPCLNGTDYLKHLSYKLDNLCENREKLYKSLPSHYKKIYKTCYIGAAEKGRKKFNEWYNSRYNVCMNCGGLYDRKPNPKSAFCSDKCMQQYSEV